MLPEKYQRLDDTELKARIIDAKNELSRRLIILGHHYQREEVIEFADLRGDSFGLSKIASEQKDAEFIVFCGVYFMAEAAKVLSHEGQKVFLPDLSAGCPMADMAGIDDVEGAWSRLSKITDIKKTIPITYMNSTAELKAFCGRNGGIVCTSGNAERIFKWALERGDKIFFLPDENLGRNTARKLIIPTENVMLWDTTILPPHHLTTPLSHQILLWPGYCHVHTYFTVDHVNEARKKYPACKIIVHPECDEKVVMLSDDSGSTEGICKFVAAQPEGSTIVIGTEINLIVRLAKEYPDKKIVPLARSLCPNMFKVSLKNLCWTLESLVEGKPVNEVSVPNTIAKDALLALDRMLKA